MKIDRNNLKEVEYLLKYYREGYKALREELELIQADKSFDPEDTWLKEKLESWDTWLSSAPESFSYPLTLLTDGLKKAFLSYPNLTDEELNDAAVDTLTNPVNYDEPSDFASSNSIWDEIADPCSGWEFETFDDDFEDEYPTFEEMLKESKNLFPVPATKDVVINITVPVNTTVEITIKTTEATTETKTTTVPTETTTTIDPLGWYNDDYEDEYVPEILYAGPHYFEDEIEHGYDDLDEDLEFLASPFGNEIKSTFDSFWDSCLPEYDSYFGSESEESVVEEPVTVQEENKAVKEETKAVDEDIPDHLTFDCDPNIDFESLLSAITTAAALRYKETAESTKTSPKYSETKEKLANTLKQADLGFMTSLALKGVSKALTGANGSLKNIIDELNEKDPK